MPSITCLSWSTSSGLVKFAPPGVEKNLGGQVAAPVFAGLAAEIMRYLDEPTTVSRTTGR